MGAESCTCQDCRRTPSRWWPATDETTGLPEMWLVATDDERLAIAPAGMYAAGQRVHVGVTR